MPTRLYSSRQRTRRKQVSTPISWWNSTSFPPAHPQEQRNDHLFQQIDHTRRGSHKLLGRTPLERETDDRRGFYFRDAGANRPSPDAEELCRRGPQDDPSRRCLWGSRRRSGRRCLCGYTWLRAGGERLRPSLYAVLARPLYEYAEKDRTGEGRLRPTRRISEHGPRASPNGFTYPILIRPGRR